MQDRVRHRSVIQFSIYQMFQIIDSVTFDPAPLLYLDARHSNGCQPVGCTGGSLMPAFD